MPQTIVGIDIGSYSVKVCQLERSLRDFELVAFHEQVLSVSPRLTHEESAAATLRAIFEKNEISADVVAVSLPAHHMACRVFDLPFTSAKKIEQTIDFELEQFVPVPLEELLIDYHILSIGENHSTVLSAYLPRTRFVKYLDMLQLAGIDPKYAGVDAIDLSHITQIAMVPQGGVYGIIDIGHEKTNVCVMDGLKLKYVRSLTIGGMHFTRAVQKAFKLNFEKAESLKIDRGRVSVREEGLDQISRILQEEAAELLVLIRQTYLGYRQIYPDRPWMAIYLCGGGSKLPGLADLISSSMRLNVSTLDCLEFIDHRLDHPDACRESIPMALALTLKVIFSNKAVKINFCRGEFAYKKDIRALGTEIKQAGVWFAAVLALGVAHYFFSYYFIKSRIDKADEQIVKMAVSALPELKDQKTKTAGKLLTIVNGKIAEVKTQLEALKPAGGVVTSLTLLLEVSKKIPSKEEIKLDVDDFSFTGDYVRIDGRTTSFEAVDKLKNSLSTSPYFKNVETRNVAKGIRDEIKFSLSMEVAGAGTEPKEGA
ncbi:MAG: pilus assembly protein PilM [Deltaproteobacteria bacterium]|nr:pilus assembly protein PilM [Deltaproteobacteria bacterium]